MKLNFRGALRSPRSAELKREMPAAHEPDQQTLRLLIDAQKLCHKPMEYVQRKSFLPNPECFLFCFCSSSGDKEQIVPPVQLLDSKPCINGKKKMSSPELFFPQHCFFSMKNKRLGERNDSVCNGFNKRLPCQKRSGGKRNVASLK